jgi:hypothetical protein
VHPVADGGRQREARRGEVVQGAEVHLQGVVVMRPAPALCLLGR